MSLLALKLLFTRKTFMQKRREKWSVSSKRVVVYRRHTHNPLKNDTITTTSYQSTVNIRYSCNYLVLLAEKADGLHLFTTSV